jgi:hypothetical protein
MKLLNWLVAAMLGLLAAAGSAVAQSPEEIVRGIYEGGGARSSIDRLRHGAAGPGQLRRPGRYCFASRSSQLKIDVASSGSAQISLDHLGQNGHSCGVEGIGRPVDSGWQLELEGVKGPCRLTLVVSPAGRLTTRDPGGSCRATYCGMRAELADVAIDLRRGKRSCRN